MAAGRVYCGGSALVEKLFNAQEDELLYVGDHIFMDANAVKALGRAGGPRVLGAMKDLDGRYDEGHTFNKHWGYLTRASHNDKSHLQRQIEKYADIYCAKVTDLYKYTPYHYFRAAPQILAHESDHAHD
ncbi:5'-nucleotidase [Aureococcus anophagefferens]|nr:5'-nucleotidase [Aureococcus anophagefferens]